ncbi:hypothetical protein [Streptomyces violascens]|nr:hypothetical protein [Streptomyces violascens]
MATRSPVLLGLEAEDELGNEYADGDGDGAFGPAADGSRRVPVW